MRQTEVSPHKAKKNKTKEKHYRQANKTNRQSQINKPKNVRTNYLSPQAVMEDTWEEEKQRYTNQKWPTNRS